jgi:histidyl-tRNA synthetase
MSSKKRDKRPEARLPKGMRDIEAPEIRAVELMLNTIRRVYESYGFEPLDTPAFEYTDALGKFLPDQDRPNEGVFSFQDEDEQWLSLRYDLTAPLARYVAQNYDGLPKPFRRYQTGPVWRNEKPGPGRFRQFTQFDADTVGTDNIAADAEMCMLAADTMEALGLGRDYGVRVSNRKILDGLMEVADLAGSENASRRLIVLRAIDKLDKLPTDDIELLLGSGRKDESGDFTPGAKLENHQIHIIMNFIAPILNTPGDIEYIKANKKLLNNSTYAEGQNEIDSILLLARKAGFDDSQIWQDYTVVRGLEYYTGPVFEIEQRLGPFLARKNEDGRIVRFGSVGGGGRYDGLVSRFKGVKVPATGISIGISRLYATLKYLGKLDTGAAIGPAVVLVMDREQLADYNNMARTLRDAGIRAEMYLGTSGMKAQMKYADKRGSPCVIIQGGDERNHPDGPRVTIKDMILGEQLSQEIADNQEWREGRPAQFSVKEDELVEAVRSVLARHSTTVS